MLSRLFPYIRKEYLSMQEQQELKRGLKSRHLTMISLGGAIGTGLFLASGGAIHTAGPGGALLAYAIIGVMVYFLMTSLAELAAYMPEAGSFSTYASRFVDPSFGFALGWNYWYNWAITIAAELSAGALIMKFWFPNSSSILWSALFLLIMFGLNYLSVKGFGESEFWFSLIKVVTVIIFLVIGIMMIFGIFNNEAPGFKNFTLGDGPIHGGFFTVLGIFMAAGFSFQGTELLGVAAGASDDVRVSPFTLIFERAGLAFAASAINAVILTAVLSAGNSGMYASTRMLWNLAKDGKAPRFLAKVNKRGVPVNALIATALVGTLAFGASFFGDGAVYTWLLNASGMSGFIAWLGIAISHYRFRRAFVAQGHDLSELPYHAKLFPFGPIFAFILCAVVILGQNYSAFMGDSIDWYGVLVSYIGLPLFLIVWLGYKWTKKSKLIPLKECQVTVKKYE